MCRFLLFSLFRRSHWRLSVGSPGFCVLDPVLKPGAGVELPKEVFTSWARWMPLTIEWNDSTNMFYFLKNLLLLILVIFKVKCNKLILKEIMVLNASYVCLHALSLHRESPDPDPGRWTPHFWGGSVTQTPLKEMLTMPHAACLSLRKPPSEPVAPLNTSKVVRHDGLGHAAPPSWRPRTPLCKEPTP
jgi:hypothetical protein